MKKARQKAKKLNHIHRRMIKLNGHLLSEFELAKMQKHPDPIEIKDVQFIASYNWSSSQKPVIFVPGMLSFS